MYYDAWYLTVRTVLVDIYEVDPGSSTWNLEVDVGGVFTPIFGSY